MQPRAVRPVCTVLLLYRCLLAKTYNAAAPLVNADLTEVDPARTAVKATDVLLYCYYGGMVATGGCRHHKGSHSSWCNL